MITLIDAHAHLDEIKDIPTAIQDAVSVGVIAIITAGIGYDSNKKALEISRKYEKTVHPVLGLHPWQLGQISEDEVELSFQQVEKNIEKIVAIGEIGLDYHKKVRALVGKKKQQAILRRFLELAVKYEKPVVIHSRYAWKDALLLTVQAQVKKVLFHWYTGPSSILRDIINRNYFISATPAVEYHAEHRRAVKEIPLSRLLLETDAPVVYGRESRYISEPKDVLRSLVAISKIRGIPETAVAEQTTQNAHHFFGVTV